MKSHIEEEQCYIVKNKRVFHEGKGDVPGGRHETTECDYRRDHSWSRYEMSANHLSRVIS